MRLVLFGAGYCSKFILPLIPICWKIIGTHKKKPNNENKVEKYNIERYSFSDFIKNKKSLLNGVTHILNSIPPNETGDIVLKEICEILKDSNKIKWIGYFSTTGVYGDHDGNWVNETSELKTKVTRSKNRIKAESQYLESYKSNNLPVHIFRLPGIYGPDRSVLDRIRNKNIKIIKKENQFFSRVHVKDIATCIKMSMDSPTPGEIYNVSDDYPCSTQELITYGCNLIGYKVPEEISFHDKSINEMTKSFYLENKKISNKKIKEKIGWKPKFKDFKEGLDDIFNTF